MNTLTIPRNLIKNDDLVILPRKEYERLLSTAFLNKEVVLTLPQKKRLYSARENLSAGKSLTFNELRKKLGVKN